MYLRAFFLLSAKLQFVAMFPLFLWDDEQKKTNIQKNINVGSNTLIH